ncbi:MAG: hypothetical protein E6J82_08260 [Deltaproteobacteria bacterium]|nr:MAG: hypothetical protein E6J82_08260 [Deltaproteobacteria bacterium]
MLKGIVVACACALAIPVQARANEVSRPKTVAPPEALPQQVYEVQQKRSPGSVIVTDAIGGQNDGWGNWQRDVLIGAGIGLGVGLIVGVADAASSDRTFTGPVADRRETGFNSSMPVYGNRF